VTARDDSLGDPAVGRLDDPLVEIEVLPNVTCYVEGTLVPPGKRTLVDARAAVHLVQQRHAKITGSESEEQTKKRLAKEAK
jgi:hypothetical protein